MSKHNSINKLARIALFVIVFIGSNSCEEMFDAKIGDKVFPEQHYKNATDVWSSFDGIVLLLQEIMPNHIIMDGLLSDQLEPTESANADLVTLYNHAVSAGNSFISGSPYYKVIISANDILANVDAVVDKDRINYDTLTNVSVKRALITLRSWAYLNYVRLYGTATILPEELLTVEDAANVEIVDRETMLNRLVEDLVEILHDNESGIAEKRIDNSLISWALLGEVYLELGNYAEAAKCLMTACDNFGRTYYKVDIRYSRDKFSEIFMNPSGAINEVMVNVPFSFEDGQKNPLEIYFKPEYEYSLRPAPGLVNRFLNQRQANDTIFGDIFRGLGVSFDSIPGTDSKYFVSKFSLTPNDVPYSGDIVLYRASDIHLMLAEALNQGGDSEMALVLLNDGVNNLSKIPTEFRAWRANMGVRGRVFLKPESVPDNVPDKVAYVEELIMNERAMELAFEGKRWFDLMRVARRRNDPSYLANIVAAKYSSPSVAERVKMHLMIEENWYLPVSE